MEKRLLELLNKVFSQEDAKLSDEEQHQRKLDEQELISTATMLYSHLNMDFGNAETGKMDTKNLKLLYKKLCNLKELFDEIFTYDGGIKICGRDKCISLMESISEFYPYENFGDTTKGIMYVGKLLKYRNSIFEEYKYA